VGECDFDEERWYGGVDCEDECQIGRSSRYERLTALIEQPFPHHTKPRMFRVFLQAQPRKVVNFRIIPLTETLRTVDEPRRSSNKLRRNRRQGCRPALTTRDVVRGVVLFRSMLTGTPVGSRYMTM